MQIKSALLFNSDIRLPISDFYFLNSARDKKLNHKKSRENVHGLFEIQKKKTVGWAAHGPLKLLNVLRRRLRPWGRPVAIDLPPPPASC